MTNYIGRKMEHGRVFERYWTKSYRDARTKRTAWRKEGFPESDIINLDKPQTNRRGGGQRSHASNVKYMQQGGGVWSDGELAALARGGSSEASDYTFRTSIVPPEMQRAAQQRLGRRLRDRGMPEEDIDKYYGHELDSRINLRHSRNPRYSHAKTDMIRCETFMPGDKVMVDGKNLTVKGQIHQWVFFRECPGPQCAVDACNDNIYLISRSRSAHAKPRPKTRNAKFDRKTAIEIMHRKNWVMSAEAFNILDSCYSIEEDALNSMILLAKRDRTRKTPAKTQAKTQAKKKKPNKQSKSNVNFGGIPIERVW